MLRKLFPRIEAGAAGGFEAQRVKLALGHPNEYIGRPGYDPSFISGLPPVPMPVIPPAWLNDRAPVTDLDLPAGTESFELKYQHFSVVMSKSRRMPFFSCVNIDGTNTKKVARTDVWKYDPRIDKQYQLITDGIYGHAHDGLFSRGHMTRREDPNWGTKEKAQIADEDTFHVTNACPQFQAFNAPIWLGLEDYVLRNSDDDDMRVNVFTGPIFDDENDPVYKPPGKDAVQVPVQFWKIVVFRHDDGGNLACAAYYASQAKQLPRKNLKPAFVFGEYEDFQLTVEELEGMTQLGFGDLKDVDVLAAAGNGFRLRAARLEDVILG
jgi:endonuclease G, mitochondrial